MWRLHHRKRLVANTGHRPLAMAVPPSAGARTHLRTRRRLAFRSRNASGDVSSASRVRFKRSPKGISVDGYAMIAHPAEAC